MEKKTPIIQKRVKLVGSKGTREVEALFDSGATYSCIRPDIAREIDISIPLPEPMVFGSAKNGDFLTANEAVRLNFFLKDCRFSDEFMLIPDLSEELIIGAKTLQAWRMKLDFEADDVIVDPRVTKLRLMSTGAKLICYPPNL